MMKTLIIGASRNGHVNQLVVVIVNAMKYMFCKKGTCF